jgi:NADH-quinone oxidoreductase subunit L
MNSAMIILFAPLVGSALAIFGQKTLGDRGAQFVTCFGIILSAVLSTLVFIDVAMGGNTASYIIAPWIESGNFIVNWSIKLDTLTAVMLIVVTYISSAVHVYSVGYMSHDKHKPRFMSYLSLFTFAMLALVMADNFVQMFFGWEGVGLASYLLINFWYEKDSANAASIKAFLVNRVGDFGFALGIFAIFYIFGSVHFDTIFGMVSQKQYEVITLFGTEYDALTVACLLLFMGAMGKSAQLGLHTWLPDAMEGPTPVSALIHAATMVTAGVFMIARLSPIFEYAPIALAFVTIIGALTAFVAATIGLTQFDIKRVIAYSTMSQLGYMFFAAGVGAYGAAIFHLFTHAFFKALLFLGAGSVIHALSDEQDMRNMGGVWRKIPATYALMWIGSLALAGIPLFAGYYSKDMIIEVAHASGTSYGNFAFIMGVISAFMTAFYSWRLIMLTFHGKTRCDEKVLAHVHESPPIMMIPLIFLGIGAIFSGMWGYQYFVGDLRADFWGAAIFTLPGEDVIDKAHHISEMVKYMPLVVSMFGIILAVLFYSQLSKAPAFCVKIFKPIYQLFYRKWYFDELYDFVFIKQSLSLGKVFWKSGDQSIIDGFGPDGTSSAVNGFSARILKLQTGYIYHYAFAMIAGLIALMVFVFVRTTG